MITTVQTENYILRGIQIYDAQALFQILSDKETMKFITPHPVSSLEEMKKKLEGKLRRIEEMKELSWVIFLKASQEMVGIFDFHKINIFHKKAEMRAIIKKQFQQKGVMTEVLQLMIDYGFDELGLNRIVGDIFSGNIGSQKLLEDVGFKKEGILRETDFDGENYHDTVVYSMLKRERG